MRRLILVGLGLLISASLSYAGDYAEVQLGVATPAIARAGEKVSFQYVIANTGSETWNTGEYSVFIEIYSNEKKILRRLEEIFGTVTVASGRTTVGVISFEVPVDYADIYFYTVNIKHKDFFLRSNFYSFEVISREVVKKAEAGYKLNGNITVSGRKPLTQDIDSNLNLNLAGKIAGTNVNASTNIGQGYQTYLFSVLGKAYSVSAGNISTNFSSLTLSGMTLKTGVNASFDLSEPTSSIAKKFEPVVVFAQSVSPKEGTEIADGAYVQYLIGGRCPIEFNDGTSLGVSIIDVFDHSNSILIPGPNLKPQTNLVIGVDYGKRFSENLNIGLEAGLSQYDADASDVTSGNFDFSASVSPVVQFGNFGINTRLVYAGPDYRSLGSPSVAKDRTGGDCSLNYPFKYFSPTLGAGFYADNVQNNPAKTTLHSISASAGTGINIPKVPLNFNYTFSRMINPSAATVDNFTNGYSAGLNYSLPRGLGFSSTGFNFTTQISDYTDNISLTNGIISYTYNYSLSTSYLDYLSLNQGFSWTDVKNKSTGAVDNTISTNLMIGFKLIPDILSTSLSGNYSRMSNTAGTTRSVSTGGNLEVTYNITKAFFVIGGGEVIGTIDELNSVNNSTNVTYSMRAGYNF